MNEKILLIDDDVDMLLDYLVDKLQEQGYRVIPARSLSEAIARLKEFSDINCAILDIMMPLSEEDDTIFEEYTGRKPTGPEDAMQAGLALIQPLRGAEVPILVLTHLSEETGIGAKVWKELHRLEDKGEIVIAMQKPPTPEFYNALSKGCRGNNE